MAIWGWRGVEVFLVLVSTMFWFHNAMVSNKKVWVRRAAEVEMTCCMQAHLQLDCIRRTQSERAGNCFVKMVNAAHEAAAVDAVRNAE